MTRSQIQAKYGSAGLAEYDKRKAQGESDDFILSALIGFATDSAILGGLLGGDIVGGIVGDLFDGDLFD